MFEPRAASRTAFLWVGAITLVVVVAVTAFVIVVLFADDDQPNPEVNTEPVPAVQLADELRSAPAANAPVAARIEGGTEVRIVGRTEDASWIFVEVVARPDDRGWIETAAVAPVPATAAITVMATSTATRTPTSTVTASPTATVTLGPELPDLQIDDIFARENRVVVAVINIGTTDALAEIFVTLDGGDPRLADVKPGEPLRPNDRLEIVLEDEYVQRRALITATISTNPVIEEIDLENNTLETVITPDIPNDLAISTASFSAPGGALRVTVRNTSVIPLAGTLIILVRERGDVRARLGTAQPGFSLAPNEELAVDFPEIVNRNIADLEIRLSSESINDADPTNDAFPR